MNRFRLSGQPIESSALLAELTDPRAGGFCQFDGRVRNIHQGRAVLRLDYQAYSALAEREGGLILREAQEHFAILDAACVHRTGTLTVGEIAVWVGVAAGHRDAAFAACRYIIDEVKRRVPIWKREHFANGEAMWVHPETN